MMLTVLDKGFVGLDGFMGGDDLTCQVARVSTGSKKWGEKENADLIEHLLASGHDGPFEHSVFRFHVKCPIFVMRQWVRHRISSFNEMSGRYRELPGDYYMPPRERADETFLGRLKSHCDSAVSQYRDALANKVPREIARLILPLNVYTEFYWTINFRSLINFIKLRMDPHAQREMQEYAFAVAFRVEGRMPVSFEWARNLRFHPEGVERYDAWKKAYAKRLGVPVG